MSSLEQNNTSLQQHTEEPPDDGRVSRNLIQISLDESFEEWLGSTVRQLCGRTQLRFTYDQEFRFGQLIIWLAEDYDDLRCVHNATKIISIAMISDKMRSYESADRTASPSTLINMALKDPDYGIIFDLGFSSRKRLYSP